MFKNETEADEVKESRPRVEGIPRVELVLPKIVSPAENVPLNPPTGKYLPHSADTISSGVINY